MQQAKLWACTLVFVFLGGKKEDKRFFSNTKVSQAKL
jgi:hypothetical protein